MNTFTKLVNEAHSVAKEALAPETITQYLQKVGKQLPRPVLDAIYLTQKYELLDKTSVEEIVGSSKSSLKSLSKKYNIPEDKIEELWKLLKDLKTEINLIPQMQSAADRTALERGKLRTSDLTIDLSTPTGRNEVVKMYMPLIYKVVNKYIGKSNLSKQDLISSALEGFTKAMDKWRKEGNQDSTISFKTYAAYQAQYQILNDMGVLSHTLSGSNSRNVQKYGSAQFDALSISNLPRDAEGEIKQDYLKALGTYDDHEYIDPEKLWDEIYEIIEKRFPQKNVNIFYRIFGLHGFKKEKSKDIAKSLGVSEGNIRNSYINPIFKYLKTNPKSAEILATLQQAYNESLMCELIGFNKNEILEVLTGDDIFLMLEDLNRWSNGEVLKQALKKANPDSAILKMLAGDFDTIDSDYKKEKKNIVRFLSFMYPTENISRMTDVALIDKMSEIQMAYKKLK